MSKLVTTENLTHNEAPPRNAGRSWSRKKKDAAPRGVFRHPSKLWAIRYTCGAGHLHKEKVGPAKSEAVRRYHERRSRAYGEPGWCPQEERRRARDRVRADEARARHRISFRDYAGNYLAWAKQHKRSWRTDSSRIAKLGLTFGDQKLDEVTSAEVERFRDDLLESRSTATANRYRDLLSGIFRRAVREGYVTENPARGVSKFRENNEQVVWLSLVEERALLSALAPQHRPLFLVSVHTGLRWSEQIGLRWREVDFLTGTITVRRSKHGQARRVPMNTVVRAVLMDLAGQRQRPGDPEESVFSCRPTEPAHFFPKAVARALAATAEVGQEAPHLRGYTWHGNRHTFASRLVMAGVDLNTVRELLGHKTMAMVHRYAHLSPAYLSAGVERLVPAATELSQNYPAAFRQAAILDSSRVSGDD